MAKIKKIDHVALITGDLEAALGFWHDVLGLDLGGVEDVSAEQSVVAFMPVGDSEIELVKPTTTDSGLARYLEKRGPGMHHICLEVDSIEEMLARLKEKDIHLINDSPVSGLDGRKYVFIHPKSTGGVLVELYEIQPDA